jgi:hypothetical protein
MAGFIELRDRFEPRMDKVGSSSSVVAATATTSEVTPNEAQLAAMLENAKNSSWRDNLRNAADAQGRFMLPGREVDDDDGAPEYVRRINARSREILRDEGERRERERRDESDPWRTRFWR